MSMKGLKDCVDGCFVYSLLSFLDYEFPHRCSIVTVCKVDSFQGKVIEPLKDFHKDEVRELGESLGLPRSIVMRHPFPGNPLHRYDSLPI